MRYLIIVLFLLIGCEEKPREFTSIEIMWLSGEIDTLNSEDGFITYLGESIFNDEQIAIHKWNDFENPIIIKTDRLRYFKINYVKSDL